MRLDLVSSRVDVTQYLEISRNPIAQDCSLAHVLAAPLGADRVQGSNIRLPIADQVADLLISHGVTHHTMDPLRCFSELVRVLRPVGRSFYAVCNWTTSVVRSNFFRSSLLKAVRHTLGQQVGRRSNQVRRLHPVPRRSMADPSASSRSGGRFPLCETPGNSSATFLDADRSLPSCNEL
jgi:SAM-dependent methyltransferase